MKGGRTLSKTDFQNGKTWNIEEYSLIFLRCSGQIEACGGCTPSQPGVQTPARPPPHPARRPHAYKWREDGRLGVRPRRTGVLAMHACLEGVQALHALRTGYRTVPNGTLIRVPLGTLIRVPLGTLIRVPLGTLIRVPRGSRKPLDSRGLREPGRTGVPAVHACPQGVQGLHTLQTGVHGQHACPARPHAEPAVLTPFAFGGACARPSGVPLSSPLPEGRSRCAQGALLPCLWQERDLC
ncbi:hypothetical protein PCANC_12550 [Puccinia coronata f. sp. avenae]|uniref:Uncharacterized protein n=1 Tax=Puccinia coronata f. sp. avenae TaxID=200324 RepID=A0A2N5SZL7_9BASI|nr:hypothetical protein PCANC_12550 [Puccinia coronata f. sp. avenae]